MTSNKIEEILEAYKRFVLQDDSNETSVAYPKNVTIKALNKTYLELVLEEADAELSGCDGYEPSTDSIKCQWCGETEFTNIHSKSRFKQVLNQRLGEEQ